MKKMSFRKILSVSAVAVLGCFLSAGTANAQELKIGVVTTLTGEKALTGVYSRNGIMLALEEINGKGGVNGIPAFRTCSTSALRRSPTGIPNGATP